MPFQVGDRWSVNVQILDSDIPLDVKYINQINLIESIYLQVPYFEFNYDPPAGLFYEAKPLTGMEPIDITVSQTIRDEEREESRYRIALCGPQDDKGNRPEAPALTMRGFLDPIEYLQSGDYKVQSGTVSQALEQVVSPVASDTRIEDTKSSTEKDWIQPGWTHSRQIDYLTGKAVNDDDHADYFSFFNKLGQFRSQTMGGMIDEPSKPKKYSELVYTSGQENKGKTEKGDAGGGSNKEKNIIIDLGWTNDLIGTMQGALGFQEWGYDRSEGKYVMADRKPNSLPNLQGLTDRLLFRSEDYLNGHFSTGRDNYSGYVSNDVGVMAGAQQRVFDSINRLSSCTVLLRNRLPRIHAGDKVRVVVYDQQVEGGIQQVITGDWIVETKVESIMNDFYTHLVLTRRGINDPRTDTFRFEKMPGGKI